VQRVGRFAPDEEAELAAFSTSITAAMTLAFREEPMPVTIEKRNKEKARQDRRREKEIKRQQRRDDKGNKPAIKPGEDPDIAGIVPGPQPIDPTLT
jgi:hypothetical protein